jgi:hypothetical protein
MADAEFWRKLATEFRSLRNHVPEGFHWAGWNSPGADIPTGWILADHYLFRMEFTTLAFRATQKLEPHAVNPLAAWLDALKRHSPPSLKVVDKSRDIGVLSSEGKEIRWIAGELHNLCTASADFCKALELGALLQDKAGADFEKRKLNGPIPAIVERIETIAEQLRRLRLEARLTVEALTEALGDIDQRNVERHLSGETIPRIGNIGAYERVFSNAL